MNDLTKEQLDRFWSKVDVRNPSECWLWRGSKNERGYGRLTVNYKIRSAHRTAYELEHGIIPKGMSVCHTCDTPSCCNPAHLWVGTHQDNMQDAVKKGRKVKRVDFKKAQMIRELYATRKHTQQEIAAIFGVHNSLISLIVNGKRWAKED